MYGAPTDYRAGQIFNTNIRRVKSLDETILKIFVSSDIATEKAIAIIAAMKTDLLFFEFTYEVYREKLILGDERITDKDPSIFFANKRTQSDIIEIWASMSELLDYLDVSRESVLRWISHRNTPAHKVGRVWKFKFSEVDEWIRSGGAEERDDNKDSQTEE